MANIFLLKDKGSNSGDFTNPSREQQSNISVQKSKTENSDVETKTATLEQLATQAMEPLTRPDAVSAGDISVLHEVKLREDTMSSAGHAEQLSGETRAEDPQATPVNIQAGIRRRKTGPLGMSNQDPNDGSIERITKELSTNWGKKPLKHAPFTAGNQIKAILFKSWINILLVAAPVGIVLNYVHGIPPIAVFLANFVAIVPLAALLSYATEEIALRVGEVLGGLLNATFGNAVELIVSILALKNDQVVIVKTSLIGSILSNLLLVMGMCFFFGGLRRKEQFFNVTVASTAASLLAMAIASVIIPTAFDKFSDTTETPVASLSRAVAMILLVVYGCYLLFQLKTHSIMYQQESQKVAIKPRKQHVKEGGDIEGAADAVASTRRIGNNPAYEEVVAIVSEELEQPQLHIWVAVGLLAIATIIIAFCAEFMVGSINAFSAQYNISQEFIGLILLPIVGNAAEHATAVTVGCKDKMDLAIGVTVGSSLQVALLVIPSTVILGWILGNDNMNLSFDGYQVSVLFVSVLLVNYILGDGKSNYLEGVMLQALYIIIAVTAWYYPVCDPAMDPNSAACVLTNQNS